MVNTKNANIAKKTFIIIFVILITISLITITLGYHIINSGLPDYEEILIIKPSAEDIIIKFDGLGRPVIESDRLNDLFFAQGFLHARDRLWQLELHRRASQGRLSEIIGAAGLEMDREFRTVGLRQVGERLMKNSDAFTVEIAENYIAGINKRLEDNNYLPPELKLLAVKPEPWEVEEVFIFAALVAYQSARNADLEKMRLELFRNLEEVYFRELLPAEYENFDLYQIESWIEDTGFESSQDHLTFNDSKRSFFYPNISLGSNAWAVSPERSATGNVLFAFDSHDAISFPGSLYEVRMVWREGELEIFGWSVPGLPGIINGYNTYLAWGMTTAGDTQDLFLEKRHPGDDYLFLLDEEWYEADRRIEKIDVRFRNEVEEHEVIITRNGPLVNKYPPVSLAWTGHHIGDGGFDALLKMNLASNWEEFRDGINGLMMPASELVYADIHGNIALRTLGLIPLRKSGSGIMPSPGWDSDYGWEGFIPMEDLPEVLNPPAGFVAAANYKAATHDYPFHISMDTAPPYRYQRIAGYLERGKNFTVSDFQELQGDWYNLHAAEILPRWLGAINKNYGALDELGLKALAILNDWSKKPLNNPDAIGAAIFETWYINYLEAIFSVIMGADLYKSFISNSYLVYEIAERLAERSESVWVPNGQEIQIVSSFHKTLAGLKEKLGDNPANWRWDSLQNISFDHELGKAVSPLGFIFSRGPFPTGGGPMTVCRASYRLDSPFRVNHASSMRTVAELKENPDIFTVIPGGQSGHLLSPHYDDQLKSWLEREYFKVDNFNY